MQEKVLKSGGCFEGGFFGVGRRKCPEGKSWGNIGRLYRESGANSPKCLKYLHTGLKYVKIKINSNTG